MLANKRRLLLAALAAAPWMARAQSALPLIAMLSADTADKAGTERVELFRQGLKEAGIVEGRDAELAFLWADGRYERLPAMAEALVRRKPAVVFAQALPAALALKKATRTVPIVFVMGADPVKQGIVASLQRPGGNLTGVCQLYGELGAKRVELLHELLPSLKTFVVLSNPSNANAKEHAANVEAAARKLGMSSTILHAGTEQQIDAAFDAATRAGARAMLVADDPFYNVRGGQIVEQAAKHALPVVHFGTSFVVRGGLISYGSKGQDNTRLATDYVARVFRGTNPADLPVLQPTKFELVINMKAANALGITMPPGLRLRADEVIE